MSPEGESQPQIEGSETVPVRDQRSPWGWILLFGIFIFLIGINLANYLFRPPQGGDVYANPDRSLKMAVGFQEVFGSASGPLFQQAMAGLPDPKVDPKAATFNLAAKTEQRQKVTPDDLRPLARAKDPLSAAVYQIYSAEKLTEGQAQSLSSKLPKGEFVYLLVAAHAEAKTERTGARAEIAASAHGMLAALIAGFLALTGGTLLLIAYVVVRAAGKVSPLGMPLGGIDLPDADRLAYRAAECFFAYLFVSLSAGFILKNALNKDVADLISYSLLVSLILLLTRVPVRSKWFSLHRIGLTREHLGKHVLWGIGGAVANVPILLFLGMIGSAIFRGLPQAEHPITVDLQHTSNPLIILKMVLIASVAAPIIEEIMFRGTLFPALAAVTRRPWLGGIISSLLFAAIHPTGIPAWLPLTGIGGMSCFLTYQTKSLVPSIVMHAVHNFATLMFVLVLL